MVLVEVIARRKVGGADGFCRRTPNARFALDLDVMREIATAKAAPPSLTELCAQCGAYEADERPLTADVKEWLQELLDEVRRNDVSHTDLTS